MATENRTLRVVTEINADDALRKLQELQRSLTEFRKKQSQATQRGKEWEDLGRSIQDTEKAIEENRQAFSQYFKTFQTGSKTIGELSAAQRQLKSILRNLKPGSEDWATYSKTLSQVESRMSSLRKEFQATEPVIVKNKKSLADFVIQGGWLVQSLETLTDRLSNLCQSYIEYSDLQADVQKTTGLTKAEVEALGKSLSKIDTRSSQSELMELATTAGKLGITGKENIEAFVRAADQINVALGEDLGEGAIREIGKISDVFGLTDAYGIEQAYLKIGSAINSLGQASSASEAYLVEFTQRLAGVGKQAGMTVDQILGYGSALDQNAQNVEMAATAFQGFITQIFSKPAYFANLAGIEVKKFTELLQTDANQAIRSVLTALSQQGGFQQLIPVFEGMQLDGSRAVAVLTSMATNIKAVEEAQALSREEFEKGTSITNEFATKNNNAAAEVDKMRKNLAQIRVEIGEKLLPVFLSASNAVNTVVKVFASLLKTLTENKVALGAAVTVVSALAAAKLSLAERASKAALALKGFATQGKLAAALKAPFQALFLLLQAGFLSVTKGTGAASAAMKKFNTVVKANPIGLVVSLIATLVAALSSFVGKMNESRKAFREFEAGLNAELSGIDAVFTKLKEAEKGTRDYADAKKVIIDQYGQYLQGLINEQGELTNVEEAYKRVTKAVKDRWAQEALAKRTAEINEDAFNEQAKYTQRIRKNLPESPLRENQLSQIQNYQGDYVKYNSALQDYYATDEFKEYLSSLGLDDLNVKEVQTIARNAQRVRSSESTRQNRIEQEEQKYAPFMADYDIKNQIAALEEELRGLENKKELAPKISPMLDTTGIDYQINALKAKLQSLYALLNPKVEESATGGTTVKPTTTSNGGTGTPTASANPATDPDAAARKEAEAQARRIAELQKANDRAQAMLEELLEKGEEAQMNADELEIKRVKKKYEEELEAAIDYRNRLTAILADPNASESERTYANASLAQAGQRIVDIEQTRDLDVQQTKERQRRDHWDAWNQLKATDYGGTKNAREQRDEALKGVDDWANAEEKKLRLGFDTLELEEGSAEYLEQEQALQDQITAIHEAASEQRLGIEMNFQNERLAKIANGIQIAQSMLSQAQQTTSQLKDLELQKSEQIYEKDKQKLDKMLKSKQISQKAYNAKMEKLEEEKEEREKQIRKKYQLAEFAMQVAQIISTTALAAMQAYAAYAAMPPVAAIMAGIATAFGAVQIGIATAQYNLAKGYSKGGFTPKGGKDEPAGIVHKGEYVVPQWVLNTPQGMDYVNVLEAIRTNKATGYAAGGAVGGASSAASAPQINLQARTDNSALVPLLESIDRKLNGVGLVYLNRQLKDLNANYDRAKADFGITVK